MFICLKTPYMVSFTSFLLFWDLTKKNPQFTNDEIQCNVVIPLFVVQFQERLCDIFNVFVVEAATTQPCQLIPVHLAAAVISQTHGTETVTPHGPVAAMEIGCV